MTMLAADPRVVFIGQAVRFAGTAMSTALAGIADDRKIEFPVAEEMQMGVSIGLALQGFVPVSLFTRWNFLLLAANQLVNHLDKLPLISGCRPRVIVRVGVGSERPMHPGPQHTGDMTEAFRLMMPNTHIARLETADMIVPAYRDAWQRDGATVLVELSDLHNEA